MTVKEAILKTLENLPEDATVDDAMERLLLLAKVRRGMAQADAGEKISQEEARRRASEWQE